MISKKRSKISAVVDVREDGSIVLPKEVRAEFSINLGDKLMLMGDKSKGLVLMKNDLLVKMMKNKSL